MSANFASNINAGQPARFEFSGQFNVPKREPRVLKRSERNSTFLEDTTTKRLKLAAETNSQLDVDDASLISQRYRHAIRTALNRLRHAETPHQQALHLELYKADLLWSLTECVYIRPGDRPIVYDLIDWANYCFRTGMRTVIDRVLAMPEAPETHDLYWNAVMLALLLADFNTVQQLLRHNSTFERNPLLQQICFFADGFAHILANPTQMDTAEFFNVQKKVRDALRANTFASFRPLEEIAGCMIGNIEAFGLVARRLCDHWYEALPAYVLFACPGTDIDGLGALAKNLYEKLCQEQTASQVERLGTDHDRLLFHILTKQCQQMLHDICVQSSSWWFPVHLCDIFTKHDPFLLTALSALFPAEPANDENRPESAVSADQSDSSVAHADYNIRTKLLVDYADSLLHSDYWMIAVDYFLHCGTEFPTRLLDRHTAQLRPANTKAVDWLYSLALRHQLADTQDNICKAMCEKFLARRCYNEALVWALRSEQLDMINEVSGRLLCELNAEDISQLRVFDAASETFLNYPNLLLLQRFYHFRRALLTGHAAEAATRLYELVRYGMAPLQFQVVLFDQMTKLLDPSSSDFIDMPQLNNEAIQDLMRAVQIFQVQNELINPQIAVADSPDLAHLSAKLRQLRHALCNSLVAHSLS